MKKDSQAADHEMLPEYDFRGGERGKYTERFKEGHNLILLDSDVAELFPDSAAVNDALRTLAKVAMRKAHVR